MALEDEATTLGDGGPNPQDRPVYHRFLPSLSTTIFSRLPYQFDRTNLYVRVNRSTMYGKGLAYEGNANIGLERRLQAGSDVLPFGHCTAPF